MIPFTRRSRCFHAVMYDRGNWRQVYKNHQPVRPGTSAWKSVDLPDLSEIPNLEFEVINFHRVLLGTLHAKCARPPRFSSQRS